MTFSLAQLLLPYQYDNGRQIIVESAVISSREHMAKTQRKPVSVYMTPAQWDAIEKAAMLENRSVSNLLLSLGLDKAEELGLPPKWKEAAPLPRATLVTKAPPVALKKVASHK